MVTGLRGTHAGPAKRRLKRTGAGALGLAAAALIAWSQAASAAPKDKVDMLDGPTRNPIPSAFSMTDRADEGITTKVRTRGRPGHAYTLWYVIFNAPENCSDGLCGDDDIFIDANDHAAGFNGAQIAATRASVVWGNAGAVANPSGRLKLDGALATGEVPDGAGQVVVGRGEDGALVPLGVTTGIDGPHRAAIIVVLQDHGAAHDDPDLLERQLSSFQGACNPTCVDAQIAVHVP